MSKKAVFAVAALLTSFAFGGERTLRIECQNVWEGDDIGGRFEIKAAFDAKQPSLTSTTTITLTGQKPKESKDVLLAANKVCGQSVDFAKDCKATERSTQQFGYEFAFVCAGKKLEGDVYCDEDCLAGLGGAMTIRCPGTPQMPYANCKATQR